MRSMKGRCKPLIVPCTVDAAVGKGGPGELADGTTCERCPESIMMGAV